MLKRDGRSKILCKNRKMGDKNSDCWLSRSHSPVCQDAKSCCESSSQLSQISSGRSDCESPALTSHLRPQRFIRMHVWGERAEVAYINRPRWEEERGGGGGNEEEPPSAGSLLLLSGLQDDVMSGFTVTYFPGWHLTFYLVRTSFRQCT